MNSLEGKVAIVTGAARGIGAAIAERLAADGASVAINYSTSKEDAEALAKRIRGNGGKAKAIQADIGNPSQAKAFVDAAVKEFGRLDILVNNAGKFHIGPIGTVDEADVRSLFAVNVDGPIFATQAAASYFSTEGGRVINVSSIAATHPLPGLSVYSATKAALDALTRVPGLARRSVGHGAGRRGIRWHQSMNSSERSNTMKAAPDRRQFGPWALVTGASSGIGNARHYWRTGHPKLKSE
jgi:3-oxoacyl-[acyl-carrier protein] reductase